VENKEEGCWGQLVGLALLGALLTFLQSHSIWVAIIVLVPLVYFGIKANKWAANQKREKAIREQAHKSTPPPAENSDEGWTRKGGVRYRELPPDR
jgi:hypothetical protein